MEWDKKSIDHISTLFRAKYIDLTKAHRGDPRNQSAIWNKYLNFYEVTLFMLPRDKNRTPNEAAPRMFLELMNIVNYNNDAIADSIMIDNPDRIGQYLIVKRDIAEKIFLLGMV